MKRTAVSSSNLISVGYDPNSKTLEVEFREGRLYRYDQVPQRAYDDLMNAQSKGSHFHRHIRDNYSTTRLK